MDLPFQVPPGLTLETDVSAGDWIDERLSRIDRRSGVHVSEIIPTGFESYARIFHPAYRAPDDARVRWAQIAQERGRVVHPEMQFFHVVGRLDTDSIDGIDPPRDGCLPQEEIAALADTLEPFTQTPETSWFCLWEGYGIYGGGVSLSWYDGEDPRAIRARERAELERADLIAEQLARIPLVKVHPDPSGGALRAYFLFRGAIAVAPTLAFNGTYQSPNLWWPQDRSWCVATEIDGNSTYVGGSARCVEAVLADERLEALPSSVDHRFDWWSDRVNPRPAGMSPGWDG